MAARQGHGQSRTPAEAPWTVGGLCRVPRQVPTDPAFPQLLVPSLPPLLPQIAAKAPPNPRVPFLEDGTDLRIPKVSLPPQQIPAQLPSNALYLPAPGTPCDLPHPLLEPFDRLRADAPKAPAGEAEAEKCPLPRPPYGTLGLVDLEF